jgi:uncharacterized NAD(P)/FAD-binding protein YdhS
MFRRVAIIGGGAAAAALLSELLEREAPQTLHVDWYTGGGRLARGVAYGTESTRHLLNVRAASMSMFSGRPGAFLDYARQGDPAVTGNDFLPRRVYGDYLEAETTLALERARERGHEVHVLPYAVDALTPGEDGVTVRQQGGDDNQVDAAVLALGSLPPQPLPGVAAAALESGRYVVDPWPFLAAAGPDARPLEVVVVGLGLTAVDVLLELSERWPQARFTTVSRHALTPEPHLASASAPADDSAELIEAMLDAPSARGWLKLLREAAAQAHDWRTVIDSLRPHTQALWWNLPAEERARFLRHARWAWERARHRMPPQVGAAIVALEQAGRLRRLRGRLQAVAPGADGRLRLDLRPTVGEAPAALQADYVIQTVGLNTDARRSGHALVRQLVDGGHVLADPLGLGFVAAPDGRLAHEGGEAWPRLFAIGSMLRGALWESTAMPEIRQQARGLAERILAG